VAFQRERAVEITFDIDLAAKVGIGQQHRAAGGDEAARSIGSRSTSVNAGGPDPRCGSCHSQRRSAPADETARSRFRSAAPHRHARLNNGK